MDFNANRTAYMTGKDTKMFIKKQLFLFGPLVFFALVHGLFSQQNLPEKISDQTDILRKALQTRAIAYKLTEPQEVEQIFGQPQKEIKRKDGGMDVLEMIYPHLEFLFGKYRNDKKGVFTLLHISMNKKEIDIGQNEKLVLRNNDDLKKLNPIEGLQNVSLRKVDLSHESAWLATMPFDSRTEWPAADSLPAGFDPHRLLEAGKNPGLGIRSLHAQGITGRGVGLAVIDQPLLLDNEEYAERLVRYDATGMAGIPPQMHGSPIAAVAVGKDLGVAPDAALSWFAVPMWEKDNAGYIRALRMIFALNELLPLDEMIRVVSISDGRFAVKKHFSQWRTVLKEAEERGIFVVTCDTSTWRFGTLSRIEGADPDLAESYQIGKYSLPDDVIRIPAGNKTLAGHSGPGVYFYDREGGRSWAAPYLAGLAALALQVNPQIRPQQIKALLLKTAVLTSAGAVVNPTGFIKGVKEILK
ncbi:MAG TPA: hypothetical protein ENK44_02310 [Caldithrix abyssi]|uniref:Peptidase S8/S53 domain-containing protein n=1 Tax=Caldithrix abyssi TaxID=187145 RepID=A0A7V4WTR1_CALAY|nr:hypothetical protein [Caldithrix abyssi]